MAAWQVCEALIGQIGSFVALSQRGTPKLGRRASKSGSPDPQDAPTAWRSFGRSGCGAVAVVQSQGCRSSRMKA
jgi:hypothetical protein